MVDGLDWVHGVCRSVKITFPFAFIKQGVALASSTVKL